MPNTASRNLEGPANANRDVTLSSAYEDVRDVRDARTADLEATLAAGLRRLEQSEALAVQKEQAWEDERRGRRDAEATLREHQDNERRTREDQLQPSVSEPVITSDLRGKYRTLGVREILNLTISGGDENDAFTREINVQKERLWRWLQSTARVVVGWGQMHEKSKLRVESVPAWQTLLKDQRKLLLHEFGRRVRNKPSAKALFYYGDAYQASSGHSIYDEDWLFKEMMKTVMNDITDTDTRYGKLDTDSNIAFGGFESLSWPPKRAPDLMKAVQPRYGPGDPRPARAPRRVRRKKAAQSGSNVEQSYEGLGDSIESNGADGSDEQE